MSISGDILFPAAYFPPLSYFAHLLRARVIYIEQMETFPKQTYRNRCEIMTASGKTSLVVPVTKPQGNHTMTKDIEICYRESWQEQHWKTLQAGYRSSPYFSYYADIILPLFESRQTLLLLHNHLILKTISRLIGIDTAVKFTHDFVNEPADMLDLRHELSPKNRQSKTVYLKYPQVFEHKTGFIADLSILDLLFNMGPEAGRYLEGILNSWTVEH